MYRECSSCRQPIAKHSVRFVIEEHKLAHGMRILTSRVVCGPCGSDQVQCSTCGAGIFRRDRCLVSGDGTGRLNFTCEACMDAGKERQG